MSPLLFNKRLKFILRLSYPLHVQMNGDGFCAWYPDLPDVRLSDNNLETLYERMDGLRREWIRGRVQAGLAVPMPHSRDDVESAPPPSISFATNTHLTPFH